MSPRQKAISVTLGDDAIQILRSIADERIQKNRVHGDMRKVYAGDIIREAVAEYLQQRGYAISVDVDRGGYREKRKAEGTEN